MSDRRFLRYKIEARTAKKHEHKKSAKQHIDKIVSRHILELGTSIIYRWPCIIVQSPFKSIIDGACTLLDASYQVAPAFASEIRPYHPLGHGGP